MSLDEMVVMTIRLDPEQRVDLAKNCILRVCKGFERLGLHEEEISRKICDFIRLFVSADKKCSYEEYELINSIYEFDMPYKEFYDLTNGGSQHDFVDLTDQYIDSLDADLKYNICLFGLCILVSDDKVTEEEYSLLRKIVA